MTPGAVGHDEALSPRLIVITFQTVLQKAAIVAIKSQFTFTNWSSISSHSLIDSKMILT